MNKFSKLLLLSIVVLGFVLRFYNFPIRIAVDRDASLDALVARGGSQELQLPLVGPFSSAAPITTGPWYYYQMILANLIIPSVYAPWASFAISSIILILVMYRVGVILKDKRLGLILAFVVAISPVQISLSSGLGNASVLGQVAGIIIWLFLEITINNKGYWWKLLLGFMLGLAINYHFQSILMLPFSLYFFWRKKNIFKSAFYTLIGFFVAFLPLLFFDLNNHWYNLRHVFTFLILRQGAAVEIRRWLTYLFTFWPNLVSSILGTPQIFALIILFGGICFYLLYIYKDKNRLVKFYILFVFLFQILFLRYYSGPLRDNYVQFFHPFIFIFTGMFLVRIADFMVWIFNRFNLHNKYFSNASQLIIILFFSIIIWPRVQNQIKPNIVTLFYIEEASVLGNNLPDRSIAIYKCQRANSSHAWAIALLLDMKKKLWTEGNSAPQKKIGFFDKPTCLQKYDNNSEIFDLSKINSPTLEKDNWEIITPHSVYYSMVKWWYKEKP